MAPTTTPRHGARRTAPPLLRIVVIAMAAALGFVLVYAQTMAALVGSAITTADVTDLIHQEPESPLDPAAGQPINVLLMGSDVRDGGNAAIGGREAGGMRNDTTILMHIAGDRSRIDLVSIPRDAQVTVPDCTLFDGTVVRGWTGNFNIAFYNGGRQGNPAEAAACTINTLHEISGVPVHHWAVVDFTGFISMVDALGGVPMCIPERIVSRDARLELEAGPQVLHGADALAFARLRTAEVGGVSGSDLQRITRQQQLLSQLARSVLAKNLLTDAGEVTRFVRAGAESLSTDPDLADPAYVIGLAYSLRGLDIDDLRFMTIPWEYTSDLLRVEFADEAEQVWDDLRHDRPIAYESSTRASADWDSGLADDTSAGTSGDDTDPAPTPTTTTDLLDLCA